MRPVLSPIEQRILGALLEKEITVPASYPLSANGLRTACNQTTSRDPITEYDERELETSARELKDRELLRIVWAGKGSRTLKYHQLLSEQLSLEPDERALITVLLLRGPQAAGELKTRTDRLHSFADRTEVESCLERLAARPEPLVVRLEKRAGQHDPRWVHLLAPLEQYDEPGGPPPSIDREVVLADGPNARDAQIRASYGTVAAAYHAAFGDELDELPFDSWLLSRIAALGSPIADVGCGPGHVAAFLAAQGARVTGIDLTPEMVEVARTNYPDIDFEVGDLFGLMRPHGAPAWASVIAWYSLVHLAASELPRAIAALARPIAPGGHLALVVHVGNEVPHKDEWWDHEVDLTWVFHDPEAVKAAIRQAGLEILESYVRGPVGDENPNDRIYLLARKP